MKQTALNYLIDKLELKVLSQHMPFVDNIISEALEMDEKNIKDSFIAGAEIGEMFNNENRCFVSDADKYYNENFKSE